MSFSRSLCYHLSNSVPSEGAQPYTYPCTYPAFCMHGNQFRKMMPYSSVTGLTCQECAMRLGLYGRVVSRSAIPLLHACQMSCQRSDAWLTNVCAPALIELSVAYIDRAAGCISLHSAHLELTMRLQEPGLLGFILTPGFCSGIDEQDTMQCPAYLLAMLAY